MNTPIKTLVRPGGTWTNPAGNLYVLSLGPRELGFIDKPRDTPTDKNTWRAFAGIGMGSRFLGHRWTKRGAMARIESEVRR